MTPESLESLRALVAVRNETNDRLTAECLRLARIAREQQERADAECAFASAAASVENVRLSGEVARLKVDLRGLLAEAWPVDCTEHNASAPCARLCATWRKKLREVLS